jgi:hypothetical protein
VDYCKLFTFFYEIISNSKKPSNNLFRGSESTILTLKTLTGIRLWSINIVTEAAYDIYADLTASNESETRKKIDQYDFWNNP